MSARRWSRLAWWKPFPPESERSNSATAAIARVDDKTVASVRAELEAGAEIPAILYFPYPSGAGCAMIAPAGSENGADRQPTAAPWDGPRRLWSLWDMLEFNAGKFFRMLSPSRCPILT